MTTRTDKPTAHGGRLRCLRAAALGAAVAAGLLGLPLATATHASATSPSAATFGVSSGYQTWTVPSGVHTVSVSVIGGAGGDGAVVDSTCPGSNSGAAGWVSGTVGVTPGQTLTLWVGGGGHLSGAGGAGTPDGTFAGGDGGAAGIGFSGTGGSGNGGGGGAASVVWSGASHADADVLLVAGGGGGGGGEGPAVYECGGRGGNGGNPPSRGESSDQGSVDLGGIVNNGNDLHSGFPGATPDAIGAGGGGGGAGLGTNCLLASCGVGGGGRTDETVTGTAGGGAGGASYARDGIADTFFSSSGAHGQAGAIGITWGAPTSTSIGSGTADVGSPVTLQALVDPSDGGGTVRFASDGTSIPDCDAAPFTSGGGTTWQASCVTSFLPAGVHEITATYSGDTAYAGSISSGFWTVRQPTTTTVTASPASPVTTGSPLALDALIGQAYGGGSVQFTVDGTPVTGCSSAPVHRVSGGYHATCSSTAPAVGTHTLGALFSGDSIDYGSSGSAALQVVSPQSVPGAPVIGTVHPGDGSAVVDFTAPTSDGNAPITGFLAEVTPVGGGASVSSTGAAAPLTLPGLTNGTAYTVTVAATNAVGTGAASAPSEAFTPVAPLAITTASTLPSGTAGTPYTATLAAAGGTRPFVWSLAPGDSLPAGLTLRADGTIMGTPSTAVAGQRVGVHVADASGQAADKQFAITIAATPRADLGVTLTHSGTFRRGTTGTFVLHVVNTGSAGTQGRVTAMLTLPTGLVPTTASGSGWTCSVHIQVASCSRASSIAAGVTSTLSVRVQVTSPAGRTLTARATVAPTDATPRDNSAATSIRIG